MNTEKQQLTKVCGYCRATCALDTGYNPTSPGDVRYLCYSDTCPLNVEEQRYIDMAGYLIGVVGLTIVTAPLAIALYYFLLAT